MLNKLYRKSVSAKEEILFGILLLLMLVQRLSLSLNYYPISDDWFLYYGRFLPESTFTIPDLTTRPLAGLADHFLIAPIANHMIAVQLILTVMLAAAALLMCKTLRINQIAGGAVLALFITLSPIGFEGFYWIAAASRIIPSIFFISVSSYTLTSYINNSKRRYLILYIILGMFSVGFYEAFVPVYLLMQICIVFNNKKGFSLLAVPILWSILISIFYIHNSTDPAIAERASMVESSDIMSHTQFTVSEYFKLFTALQLPLIKESFCDGIKALAARSSAMILIVILAVLYALCSKSDEYKSPKVYSAIVGILLFFAGAVVSFVIGYVRLPFRMSVPMLIGGGIIAEVIFSLIFRGIAYKLAVLLLALLFTICSTGEMNLYKYTSENDIAYANALAAVPEIRDKMCWTFLCNEESYWYNDRIQHYEYVKASKENYASITNGVRFVLGTADINYIEPLQNNALIEPRNFDSPHLLMLQYDGNGSFIKCSVTKADGDYTVTSLYGELIGIFFYEGDNYRYMSAR